MVTRRSSTVTSFVRKSAPMVALYLAAARSRTGDGRAAVPPAAEPRAARRLRDSERQAAEQRAAELLRLEPASGCSVRGLLCWAAARALVGEFLVDVLVHERGLANARIAQDDHLPWPEQYRLAAVVASSQATSLFLWLACKCDGLLRGATAYGSGRPSP